MRCYPVAEKQFGEVSVETLPQLPTWKSTLWGKLHCPKCGIKTRLLDHRVHINQMLKRYTYWYRNVFTKEGTPTNGRELKKFLTSDNEEIMGILQTVDSVVIQITMSEPALAVRPDYAYFDKLIKGCILSCIRNRTAFIKRWKNQCKVLRKFILSNMERLKRPDQSRGLRLKKELMKLVFREFRFLCRTKTLVASEQAFACSLSASERRLYLQRVCHLTSYRSVGLATKEMREQSFDKFKRITTEPESGDENFAPMMEIRGLLRKLFSRLGEHRSKINASKSNLNGVSLYTFTKISVTNSGSLESSVAKGGKRAFYKNVLNVYYTENLPIRVYDLFTGQVSTERNIREYLHNPEMPPFAIGEEFGSVFAMNIGCNFGQCLQDIAIMYLFEDKIPKQVNLAIIAEAGKARTVSSGSCWLALAEYPISHIFSEILKCFPQTKSGMSAANHAYNFYRNYVPLKNEWNLVYDLETATDYGPWTVGRNLLEALEHELMLPPAYMKKLRSLAFSPRTVSSSYGKPFDTCRGWPMGEQLTKGILTFVQLLTEMATDSKSHVQSSYVGDDGLVKYRTRDRCVRHLENLGRFGLKLSPLDTWISKNAPVFFCEKVIDHVPVDLILMDNQEHYYSAKASLPEWKRDDMNVIRSLIEESMKKGLIMPYVDMIATRLLNNVSPERKTHSGQSTGKTEMLANQQRFNDPQSVILMEVVAPWIQRTLLSRQNPIDIIPFSLRGRGLYLGRADPRFFKERVPPTLAVGAYLASLAWHQAVKSDRKTKWVLDPSPATNFADPFKGVESRELTRTEKKFLFVYALVREGFHKPHDRSLSTRVPLELLLELYESLEDQDLIIDSVTREEQGKYYPLQALYKDFIAAYDEAGWYAGFEESDDEETVVREEKSEERTLREMMLSYNLPNYNEEEVYERISRHAMFERTRDIPRSVLGDKLVVHGWVPIQSVKDMRRGWLRTNTNLVNKINKFSTPDRDPEEQSMVNQIHKQLYWTIYGNNTSRLSRHVRDTFARAGEEKEEEKKIETPLPGAESKQSSNADRVRVAAVSVAKLKRAEKPDSNFQVTVSGGSYPDPLNRFKMKRVHPVIKHGGHMFYEVYIWESENNNSDLSGMPVVEPILSRRHRQLRIADQWGTTVALCSTSTNLPLQTSLFKDGPASILEGKFIVTKGGVIRSDYVGSELINHIPRHYEIESGPGLELRPGDPRSVPNMGFVHAILTRDNIIRDCFGHQRNFGDCRMMHHGLSSPFVRNSVREKVTRPPTGELRF